MAIRSLKTGSFSRSTQVGNSIILPGDYESIATVTVGSGGSSSISFSSIPSTYKHLQLRIFGSGATSDGLIYFNGDTTNANYYRHEVYGNGATVSADAFNAPYYDAGGISSSYPLVEIIDILDYANTNKNKTLRNLWGYDFNGSGRVGLLSIGWTNTSAISSISLSNRTYNQYSQIALYGIRG